MSKLVDVEKLARLATALDNRAKSLVEAEEQRANARAAFQARQNQRNNGGRKFEDKKAEAPVAPVAEAAPVAEEAQADAE